MMRRTRLYSAIVGLGITTYAVILVACVGGSAIDPLEVGDPERGRTLFEGGEVFEGLAGTCEGCHSLDGSVGEHGPSLQGISELAGDRVPDLDAVDYLRQSILDPSAYLVEGFEDDMESGYRFLLSEEDVDDLVAFLLTQ